MAEETNFKNEIYEEVAFHLNMKGIKHCAVHGIDYENMIYGRDLDLMIDFKDRKIVRSIIQEVFIKFHIHFKINTFSWADIILGYVNLDNEELAFIEIDLFDGIYYRMIELTDKRFIGISKEVSRFYINGWNTYGKVVLMKFFGMDIQNLKPEKWNEMKRVAALPKQIDNSIFPYVMIKQLDDAIKRNDFGAINNLKKRFHYFKFAIKKPFKSVKILLFMIRATLDRRFNAFKMIPIIILPKANKNIIDEKKGFLMKNSFLTEINERCLERESWKDFYLIYWYFRRHSAPLSLNIVYITPKVWDFLIKKECRCSGVYFVKIKNINDIFKNMC